MPTPTLAESILIQWTGDLSDKDFRAYIAKLAQDEVATAERLPEKMTIATALEHVEKVRQLCYEIAGDYDTAMDDPENDIDGWKATDRANDFLHRSCLNEQQARAIVLLGMSINA